MSRNGGGGGGNEVMDLKRWAVEGCYVRKNKICLVRGLVYG